MNAPHPAQLLFTSKHPLTSALDMKFIGVTDHVLTVTVTAPESFADSGGAQVHSGFSTLFLDTVMGSCVLGELDTFQPIATIKLTCNHLRQPKVGEKLVCKARHEGMEDSVAFVRGEIFSEKGEELISQAIGSFMIGTRARPLEESK